MRILQSLALTRLGPGRWFVLLTVVSVALGGCQQTPARQSAAAPTKSDESRSAEREYGRAAPAETQPTNHSADPPVAGVSQDGQPRLPLSAADQEALAEYIREQVRLQSARDSTASAPSARADKNTSTSLPVRRASRTDVKNAATTGGERDSLKSPPDPTTLPGQPDEVAGVPRLELNPTVFDFQEVWQGMPAEGEFVVRNTGTAPLTLQTRSSCGCTVATKPQSPLAPGETTTFKISYNTARAGAAHKTVTLTTNDPKQASVVINVTGKVKSLIAATPSDRVVFNDLAPDARESQTIRLVSQYDQPLALKLREPRGPEPFDVELKELDPGKLYDLTITTRPPLKDGANFTNVVLETGLPNPPTYSVSVNAVVTPPVSVTPRRLTVGPNATLPAEHVLQVESRTPTPVHVTEVRSNVDAIRCELLPDDQASAQSDAPSRRVRVVLPPYSELPATGATLQVYTDAEDEAYRVINVAVARLPARASTQPAARPASTTTPKGSS